MEVCTDADTLASAKWKIKGIRTFLRQTGHVSDQLCLALEYMGLISNSVKFPLAVIPHHSYVLYLYASFNRLHTFFPPPS